MLSLLVVVGVVTSFERFVFALVLEPIKQELQLSDSQLGLMTGIAFAGFYAVAGIPIARWADKGNRVTITALAVGLLGVMVSLCGMVGSYIQLLCVRAGVAIGEAGIVPPGQSMIADYYDRKHRPRAMAIYSSFFSISMILGYLVGGYLVEQIGWRQSFILMGLPGMLIAVIVKLTLREPRQKHAPIKAQNEPSIIAVARTLFSRPAFCQIFMGYCVAYFFSAGTGQWLATFFIRSHDMSVAEVGFWLSLTFGLFTVVGVLGGGYLSSHFLAYKERLQMQLLAIAAVIAYGVFAAMAYLTSDKYIALICLSVSALVGGMANGPLFAAIQSLAGERMRSVALAILFLFANLIGFGLAPLCLGVLSDALTPSFAQESLRYALTLFCPGALWIAFHYWRASNTIEHDIRGVEEGKKACAIADEIGDIKPNRKLTGVRSE